MVPKNSSDNVWQLSSIFSRKITPNRQIIKHSTCQPPSTHFSTAICWRNELTSCQLWVWSEVVLRDQQWHLGFSAQWIACITNEPRLICDPMLVRTVFWFSSLPLLVNSNIHVRSKSTMLINTETQQISINLFYKVNKCLVTWFVDKLK